MFVSPVGEPKAPEEFKTQARRAVLDGLFKQPRLPPLQELSRTTTCESSDSIFSTESRRTQSTDVSLPSLREYISHKNSLTLPQVLNDIIKADEVNKPFINLQNMGHLVFSQLDDVLQRHPDTLKPDMLIDWSLNLVRCMLFIERIPPSWGIQQINATNEKVVVPKSSKRLLRSELVKFIRSARKSESQSTEALVRFLRKVVNPQLEDLESQCQQLKLEQIPYHITDAQLAQRFVESDLFIEYNLDADFRLRVAQVSFQSSRALVGDMGEFASVETRALALRNYFLNLLVACQTLFEFNYYIWSKSKTKVSKEEKQVLWDRIRERNFAKVEIFERLS